MIEQVNLAVISVVGNYMYKSTSSGKQAFLLSPKANDLRDILTEMVDDPLYNTRVVMRINAGPMFFVEKHIEYMSNHLNMDHHQYVMNLKLMTKIG